MIAYDIQWDVDDPEDLEDLPTEMELPEGMRDHEEIEDYLSDETGFCHAGYQLKLSEGEEMSFFISTDSDNGSGMSFSSKEEVLKEIAAMIDDCMANGGTEFNISVNADASCFLQPED